MPNGNNDRVCAYLRSRSIAPEVIQDFVDAGLLYEDAEYHNCVFVGRDSTMNPVFATKRGTAGIPFRCDVAGSNKRIGFRLPCDSSVDRVWVFEAPIDLMSFCTLHQDLASNAVALCGLYEGPLNTYLRESPSIRYILLCLDADAPGQGRRNAWKINISSKGTRLL